MKNRLSIAFIGLLLFAGFTACEKNPPPDDDNGTPADTAQLRIYSFVFDDLDPVVESVIDHDSLRIRARVPRTADIRNLKPVVSFTEGASLSPPSGFTYDFSQPLVFTLTKGARTRQYTALVDYAESNDNQLLSARFPDLFRKAEISGQVLSLSVPYGTSLEAVKIELEISPFAYSVPASESLVDLREPLTITVFAESGLAREYVLTVTELQQETGIRAFWIAPPWHSTFLHSYDKLQQGVAMAKELNFNTLYVCAWAQGKTIFPSQVLLDNSSYTDISQTVFGNYSGGSGDMLADLISLAHAQGLKVILWFEYGFMAKWGTAPTPQNDPILAVHPHWVGINNQGQQANYNNSDYYYNGFDPEVQQFMIDLMLEAVINYDIDGVQGDDRLPAMPANSGYDEYTRNRYREEHGGADPPQAFNDYHWMRWRADIMNAFGRDLYQAVKAVKPHVFVASSPNPFPWAFNNLLQDWPGWLDDASVEILSVQCYRYSESAYLNTINEVLHYFNSHGDGNLHRLVPGIILQGSSGLTDADLLAAKLLINRSKGITGEAFFYDSPLFDERINRVIRAFYPGEAIFPDLIP